MAVVVEGGGVDEEKTSRFMRSSDGLVGGLWGWWGLMEMRWVVEIDMK